MSFRLATVMLAGGESRRYNSNKLLSRHPCGEPLLRYMLTQYAPLSHFPVVLVSGAYHEQINQMFGGTEDCSVVHNPHWKRGIASSIHTGIADLQNRDWPFSHVLMGLCDLPKITTDSLQRLLAKARHYPAHIIASHWDNKLTAPAIFPSAFLPLLMQLKGDSGAGKLLNKSLTAKQCMGVDHPEAAFDIDYSTDWAKANF